LKNILTGIETVTLKGIGTSIDLFFENGQSSVNLTKKIVLTIAEELKNIFIEKNFSIKNFGILTSFLLGFRCQIKEK
jgi:hypothetical protein